MDGSDTLPNLAAAAQICVEHGIRRLSLFGSRLKGTAHADSDIDLLVEFEPGRVPGLLALSGIAIECGRVFGQAVDLRTARDRSRHFRDDVVRDARVLYAD